MRYLSVLLATVCLVSALAVAYPDEIAEVVPDRADIIANAQRAYRAGRFEDAVELGEQLVAIDRRSDGVQSEVTLASMRWLASAYEKHDQIENGVKLRQEIVDAHAAAFGKDHWKTVDVRVALSEIQAIAGMSPEQRMAVREGRKLAVQCRTLANEAKQPESIRAGLAAIVQFEKAFGVDSPQILPVLNNLGIVRERSGQYAESKTHLERSLRIHQKAYGQNHPKTALALNSLASTEMELNEQEQAESHWIMSREILEKVHGRNHADVALVLCNLGELYRDQARLEPAEKLLRESLRIFQETLGPDNEQTLGTQNNLAVLLSDLGQIQEALNQHLILLDRRQTAFGLLNTGTADSLNNAGTAYVRLGRYAEAEELLLKAVGVRMKLLGRLHPETVDSFQNLAYLMAERGNFQQALQLNKTVVDQQRQIRGSDAPQTALALNNLAGLYRDVADYQNAMLHYLEAQKIFSQHNDGKHPRSILLLHNLADLALRMADFPAAVDQFKKCYQLSVEVLGQRHPSTLTTASGLAEALRSVGDFQQAQELHRQVVAARQQTFGESHPATSDAVHNLANLLIIDRQFDDAEELLFKSLETVRASSGASHPDKAKTLHNLGFLANLRGRFAEADGFFRECVSSQRVQLDRLSIAQSDRQQRQLNLVLRQSLDVWMATAIEAEQSPTAIYDEVLAWKGMGFQRGRLQRNMPRAAEAELAASQMLKLSRDLAAMIRQPQIDMTSEATVREFRRLTEQREDLETQLNNSLPPSPNFTSADVLHALDANTVVLDFLEYTKSSLVTDADDATRDEFRAIAGGVVVDRRLAVFILTKAEGVRLVDLGPLQPIASAVKKWRQTFGQTADGVAAATLLKELIWLPIQAHIGSRKTVVNCPDGIIGTFPLEALAGNEPATVLLEEFRFVRLPVADAVVGMSDSRIESESNALLLVGDVHYNAWPGQNDRLKPGSLPLNEAVYAEAQLELFTPLPGTLAEINSVRQVFRKHFPDRRVQELTKDGATESSVRNGLSDASFAVLATHGFFNSRQANAQQSAHIISQNNPIVVGYHPDVLSGLVLTGAGFRPPQPLLGVDDGILTAMELKGLDLRHLEIAVLSACESGLGRNSSGEGSYSICRALHGAGVRTTVASLWPVDDKATTLLMSEFWRNIWERKLSRIEALRQAKLMIRNKYDPETHSLRGATVAPADSEPGADRVSPAFWAAFQLSGDWR
ncbi:tetratricopeptide repeat protein [Fuerstiella marisgermanici]|uniref:Type IV pilus biogenesis/stability protein n=1 Tax=Fuerstiella marisgermanici TaxID=1891926 RepID=A0A1P8WGU7_9PLAN|nr:tetratricopeptide repeat protein [Fuerstiella marisgermanici]APZ93257.1 type IV pilus biogenesis/stability protein [Fuerstiella marisgermanici]